jgi:UDP-2,3-diacylglucosamine pyrophosphatase LpxH
LEKRAVDLVVLSDIHLGTYGCHARELVQYLKSIQPKTLVLNGDIIDIWQFRKRYFPADHLKVLKHFLKMASQGTRIIYITGNHDEALRRFTDFSMGNITLTNKWVARLHGKNAWFFHGDIFDASIQNAKWIAKLGGWGYDMLILINRFVNLILEKLGREKYSLSKRIKNSVKKAVKFIGDFEETAADLAIAQGYDYVICGHIHQPQMRPVKRKDGKCLYLNSGDWIENLTALEYNHRKWSLYHHPVKWPVEIPEEQDSVVIPDFQSLIQMISPNPSKN